jgi:hypothetical protein
MELEDAINQLDKTIRDGEDLVTRNSAIGHHKSNTSQLGAWLARAASIDIAIAKHKERNTVSDELNKIFGKDLSEGDLYRKTERVLELLKSLRTFLPNSGDVSGNQRGSPIQKVEELSPQSPDGLTDVLHRLSEGIKSPWDALKMFWDFLHHIHLVEWILGGSIVSLALSAVANWWSTLHGVQLQTMAAIAVGIGLLVFVLLAFLGLRWHQLEHRPRVPPLLALFFCAVLSLGYTGTALLSFTSDFRTGFFGDERQFFDNIRKSASRATDTPTNLTIEKVVVIHYIRDHFQIGFRSYEGLSRIKHDAEGLLPLYATTTWSGIVDPVSYFTWNDNVSRPEIASRTAGRPGTRPSIAVTAAGPRHLSIFQYYDDQGPDFFSVNPFAVSSGISFSHYVIVRNDDLGAWNPNKFIFEMGRNGEIGFSSAVYTIPASGTEVLTDAQAVLSRFISAPDPASASYAPA